MTARHWVPHIPTPDWAGPDPWHLDTLPDPGTPIYDQLAYETDRKDPNHGTAA